MTTRKASKPKSKTRSKNRNAINRVNLAYLYVLATEKPNRFAKLMKKLTREQRKKIFGNYDGAPEF